MKVIFAAATLFVLMVLLPGCAGGRRQVQVPQTCPENPDYYHVCGPGPTQPQTVNPTFLRHVRKDRWTP